jgi:hypothetical protein
VRRVVIPQRETNAVLWACGVDDSDPRPIRTAIESAVRAGRVLRGADLRDADLRDADLRDADLRGADLRDADLRGAVLSRADLRDADLSADLRGALLDGADVPVGTLDGAILDGAKSGFPTPEMVGRDVWRLPVPGGWLYRWDDSATFVPATAPAVAADPEIPAALVERMRALDKDHLGGLMVVVVDMLATLGVSPALGMRLIEVVRRGSEATP